MTAYYFDTSGLIKRYVTETGSDWVNQLFQPENGHFFITCRLTMPEVYSAFARRLREGSVSTASYATNIHAFEPATQRDRPPSPKPPALSGSTNITKPGGSAIRRAALRD